VIVYMGLAARYVTEFEAKWTAGRLPAEWLVRLDSVPLAPSQATEVARRTERCRNWLIEVPALVATIWLWYGASAGRLDHLERVDVEKHRETA
jgi:hypothetical protein